MNRTLMILLVALAVLVVLYLVINSARDVTYKPGALYDIDTTKVDGIIITNQNDVIKLRRVSGGWRLAEPIDYPAESRFVSDLMGKMGSLEIEALTTEDPSKDTLYGVDTSGAVVTLLAGSDTLANFIVGKAAENYRHTYCRRVGEDKIYLVRGTFTGQLNRKAKDWRDKVILEIDKDKITRLDFEYPREKFSLVKADTIWILESQGQSNPVDERTLNQTLGALSRFRTFDYVDGDAARAVDFSVPDLALTVTMEGGETYKIALLPQDREKDRYLVRKDGVENTLFVIYKGSANSLMKKFQDYKKKEEATRRP